MTGSMLKTAVLLLLATSVDASGYRSADRSIRIMNNSGSRVEIYWIDPSTRAASLMSKPHIYDGATFPLNSYVGHEFEAREMPSAKTGKCANEDQVCRIGSFRVSENDDQSIRILPSFEVVFGDSKTAAEDSANEIIEECQQKTQNTYELSDKSAEASMKLVNDMADCVENGVRVKIGEVGEEITYQARIRKRISGTLTRYVCTDDKFPMTEDLSTQSWPTPEGNKRATHIKHDRPSSQIHVIDDFISDHECSSGLYDSNIQQRSFRYANDLLGLGLEAGGQENLVRKTYNKDNADDYSAFHCDGDCTGAPHQSGSRVATIIMYCSKGGVVNFRNAGVRVKPEAGAAIFVSYMNSNSMKMDTGFTEYNDCPPPEGETKVVVQHVRFGVDDEKPWDSF